MLSMLVWPISEIVWYQTHNRPACGPSCAPANISVLIVSLCSIPALAGSNLLLPASSLPIAVCSIEKYSAASPETNDSKH